MNKDNLDRIFKTKALTIRGTGHYQSLLDRKYLFIIFPNKTTEDKTEVATDKIERVI